MSLPDHYQDTKGNAFGSFHIPRKYEEYAHVIEFTIRGKSSTVKKREGIIIQAIGEERLTLLELLGIHLKISRLANVPILEGKEETK